MLAPVACLTVLAGLFGFGMISRAQEATRTPAPAGGFMPQTPVRGAISYWQRDGGPIDMKNPWRVLPADGLHDPLSDAVKKLQNPVEAMHNFSRSETGNFVDWAATLKARKIEPRAEAEKAGQMELLNLDVVFRNTRSMPTVTFSHTVHTEWLSCSNCHDELFKRKTGTSNIRMTEIFEGKACGVCHGKVAFPPDQCFRCHNGQRRKAEN